MTEYLFLHPENGTPLQRNDIRLSAIAGRIVHVSDAQAQDAQVKQLIANAGDKTKPRFEKVRKAGGEEKKEEKPSPKPEEKNDQTNEEKKTEEKPVTKPIRSPSSGTRNPRRGR